MLSTAIRQASKRLSHQVFGVGAVAGLHLTPATQSRQFLRNVQPLQHNWSAPSSMLCGNSLRHFSVTGHLCREESSGASSSRQATSTSSRVASLSPEQKKLLLLKAQKKLMQEKNERQSEASSSFGYYLFALVVGMVGATYGAVPLYRAFCQATGYGGTIKRVKSVEEKIIEFESADDVTKDAVANRVLRIQFNADVSDDMPWKFTPTQRQVRAIPGETVLAFFTAENTTDVPINGVSTYNVSPQKAGVYFNKIQCFCFEEQRLQPKEKIDMPVFFYVDPEFATDPKMKGVDTLTLSYTFFKVEEGQPPPIQVQQAAAAQGY
mmetsp:Transcript_25243/g.30559  ORF Transcript_25243/g.30559 Transcript_25243/m.30559 type:complete len:322 (-) Transcript_25243:260-1225(-)|eukprot:CAMPEP_0197862256 /NCGR_PEP_ID=MMETSP1438-20131217/38903_1 /TAXON_ID=1461541 /ORGANISM="Pterosperma sp., Strain CCMP1384" /LENGTH=321 /DNA_ID=CAMNT_0043479765 /DNA_START=454 /DNA_END=1419 /DNA_ORIENTATION=-